MWISKLISFLILFNQAKSFDDLEDYLNPDEVILSYIL
jgi:hypothetical protein